MMRVAGETARQSAIMSFELVLEAVHVDDEQIGPVQREHALLDRARVEQNLELVVFRQQLAQRPTDELVRLRR